MSYVSTIFSGAASLGVLICLISGIFFLVLTALKWVTRVRESIYEEELRRQKRFLINNSYLVGAGTQDFVEKRKVENGLATLPTGRNHHEETESNFESTDGNGKQLTEPETDEKVSEQQDPNADTIKVREVIEKMVEAMIEGPLDGTTVGQLSTHSAYLDVFSKYHNLLCRELARLGFALHLSVVRKNALEVDSVDAAQTNLKRLIKRVVSEAMALPNIKQVLHPTRSSKALDDDDFKNKSYEDILATAILNKVIENFQNKNYPETIDGNPKPRLRKKKIRKTEDKSDDDWSDTSRSDQLSLTIEEYIEEVTTAMEEASDEERSEESDIEVITNRRIPFPESGRTVVDAGTDDENSDLEEPNAATELITSSNSWEENWLFQKKRLRSTPNAHHPVPVPMLVPNPSEDYRALVGGVDAYDLSDMSEGDDLEDIIAAEEKQPMLPAEPEKEIKNAIEEETPAVEEESVVESHQEVVEVPKGEEMEEDAESGANLPDVLAQKDRESSIVDFSHQYESLESNTPSESRITENEESTIRCRLAEREREKWSNPVFLPDNPYSQENIEKREQRRKNEYFRIGTYIGESIDFPEDLSSDELSKPETEKFRFCRDYYINASKHPAGMPSPKRSPDDHWQKFTADSDTPPEKEENNLSVQMQTAEKPAEPKLCRVVDKREFCLPSVKELAKHFSKDDRNSEPKCKTITNGGEIDYSTIPVSEIVLNLQQAAEAPVRDANFKSITYSQATQMEICRKVDSKTTVEKAEPVRFNGKEVHSLTARSISREFREGLKNNSYHRNRSRVDRSSSGGESDQGDVVSSRMSTSPTPSVDLKNMKQFWERIITANSNSTKEK